MPKLTREILKSWFFWLVIITGLAITIRSIPAWTNAAWGCDFGIYYGLTNSFVENKELFATYTGWGGSYQYFPILYIIMGAAHWITGLSILTIMPKLAPIFGGLSVLIFYFVVYELSKDRKKALLASLFLAVLPFHVYQTSHAAPLTIGHFFMMLSLYFFIKYRQHVKYSIPLICSTVLLVMSHHLTTYFFLITLIAIMFIENASQKQWTDTLPKDICYILLTSGIVFSYWIVIAKPVFESFMARGIQFGSLRLNSQSTLLLFYIVFFSLLAVIWVKRRYNLFLRDVRTPTPRSCLMKFFLSLFTCLVLMSAFFMMSLPWTNFRFTPLSILYAVPLLIIISFGVAGFRFTRSTPSGLFIRGWLVALLISFCYVLLTKNSTMPPDRHLEYIMVPLSMIAVYGLYGVFSGRPSTAQLYQTDKTTSNAFLRHLTHKSQLISKSQLIFILLIVALVASNAMSVYPSFSSLHAADEEISTEDISVIEWMEHHLDKNTSVIASDHRLSRMAEAAGFNTTVDEASAIWTEENLSSYLFELDGAGKNYSHITHVIIDDSMKNRVVHVRFGEIVYMTNASYEKFLQQPFELLFRNVTFNEEGEERDWTEVYQVNWTFIAEQHDLDENFFFLEEGCRRPFRIEQQQQP